MARRTTDPAVLLREFDSNGDEVDTRFGFFTEGMSDDEILERRAAWEREAESGRQLALARWQQDKQSRAVRKSRRMPPPPDPGAGERLEVRCKPYSIRPAEYWIMHRAQNGRCAICHRKPDSPLGFRIDHNHATGKVRGLLCPACNTGLGLLGDSPAALSAAHAYLNEHGFYGQGVTE